MREKRPDFVKQTTNPFSMKRMKLLDEGCHVEWIVEANVVLSPVSALHRL